VHSPSELQTIYFLDAEEGCPLVVANPWLTTWRTKAIPVTVISSVRNATVDVEASRLATEQAQRELDKWLASDERKRVDAALERMVQRAQPKQAAA